MRLRDERFEKRVDELVRWWNSPYVRRDAKSIARATGGLINHRTLANRDCAGTGPDGRVNLGRNVVGYETGKFFRWFLAQIETSSEQPGEVAA